MAIFPTLFFILQLVKSLPLYIPAASKRYPFRAEHPCIAHYREYPPHLGRCRITGGVFE